MTTARMVRGPQVERLAREVTHGRAVERCARVGYAARGVVYAIIGVLAVKVALHEGGRTTNSKGALTELAAQPFGAVLLALLSAGLVGFVVWRFVQALADPERKGHDAKGLAKRAMYLGSGLVYAGLALNAVKLLAGRAHSAGADHTQSWTARLLAQPFGQVLVGLVGVGIMAFAVQQVRSAWKQKFLRQLDLSRLAASHRHLAVQVSRFGLAARGVVFFTVGIFLVRAALHANAREAKGLGQALSALSRQPWGDVLLGAVAVGLVAYAVYQFVVARCRRIAAPAH